MIALETWTLKVKPLSPIRLGGVKPKSDYLDTKSYVPGTFLRGALAEHLKALGRGDEIAKLVGELKVGPLFPSEGRGHPLPLPMTALSCKNASGFKPEGHGVRDGLIPSLVYAELERLGFKFPVPLTLRCLVRADDRTCFGRMEAFGGFAELTPGGWKKVKVDTFLQTRVSISRWRRASQEGALYRVVAISPRSSGDLAFVGRLRGEEAAARELVVALKEMGLGAMATRGLGAVEAELEEGDPYPDLKGRVEGFDEALRRVWSEMSSLVKGAPKEPPSFYFSVDLLSPGVFLDDKGLPSLRLELELWGRRLSPVLFWTRPSSAGGWSTAWGLYKPTALAAAEGSSYVFCVERERKGEVLSALEEIEHRGVGLRTSEGYGEVLVCHPFHKEVTPV